MEKGAMAAKAAAAAAAAAAHYLWPGEGLERLVAYCRNRNFLRICRNRKFRRKTERPPETGISAGNRNFR